MQPGRPYPSAPEKHSLVHSSFISARALLLAGTIAMAGFAFVSSAQADKPDTPPGQEAPGCHGHNDSDCGFDPQPVHGNDCVQSEAHVCDVITGGDPQILPSDTTPGGPDGANPPGSPGAINPPSGPDGSNPPGGPGATNPPAAPGTNNPGAGHKDGNPPAGLDQPGPSPQDPGSMPQPPRAGSVPVAGNPGNSQPGGTNVSAGSGTSVSAVVPPVAGDAGLKTGY